jgi:muramoyltetrapeptide carboxypeptidase
MISPGSPIAVVAPSGIHDEERLERGLTTARIVGLNVQPFNDLLRPRRYLAAPDQHRLDQLQLALRQPHWGGIWIARGGYGMTRILDRLDLRNLPPTPVIGFSDITPLLTALHKHRGGPIIHGPVVHSLPVTDRASQDHLFALLAGRPTAPLEGTQVVAGKATGPLVGGNLCLLAATCGTPHQVDCEGAILVLEDIGEPAYKLDRMLQQLVSAGALKGVVGVALGQFTDCPVPEDADYTIVDVLMDHLAPLGVPVLSDLPIGHGPANRAFPVGHEATLADGTLSWAPVTRS